MYKFTEKQLQSYETTSKTGYMKAKIKVKCSNGKIYNSMSEAARNLDLNLSSISAVVAGRLRTTKGLKFEAV